MKVTDNMLEILKSGGSFKFQGWILNIATSRVANRESYVFRYSVNAPIMLFAVSPQGEALELKIKFLSNIPFVLETMFQEINSRSYLPKSAYNNGIRLDTENRCQSSRCNPSPGGKPRLLFVSAGQINQVIQIKCKCGYMNTFWRNRIKLDASGALKMEAV